jgi:hypothetical protein
MKLTIVTTAIVCYLFLTTANIYMGGLNQDEGWYLYASRLVYEGGAPYKDFNYTQTPLLPYIYSMFWPLINQYGVLFGRILTSTLALLGILILCKCVDKMHVVPILLITSLNTYQNYFTTITKTYSLTILMLVCTFYAINKRYLLLGGVAIMLAALTRISTIIIVPVVLGYLIVVKQNWPRYIIGCCVPLLVAAIVFKDTPTHSLIYNLVTFHSARNVPSITATVTYIIGSLSRLGLAYYVFIGLTLIILLFKKIKLTPLSITLWVSGFSLFIVQLAAPFPYDDYQVITYPILVLALFTSIPSSMPNRWVVVLLLVSILSIGSSPINQTWVVIGRRGMWWETKTEPDLVKLRNVGKLIRNNTNPDDVILTQDTYLAVEARRHVPNKIALGPYEPLTHSEIDTLLSKDFIVVALSDYGLSINSPSMTPIPTKVRNYYIQRIKKKNPYVTTINNFGQGHTQLKIFSKTNLTNENCVLLLNSVNN